jgi:serine/threonine protein kinase
MILCANILPPQSSIIDCQVSGQYLILIGETHRQVSCLGSNQPSRLEVAPQCSCLYSHLLGEYCGETLSSIVKTGSSRWRLSLQKLKLPQDPPVSCEISGLTHQQMMNGVIENFLSLVPIQEYYLFGVSYVSSPQATSTFFTCTGYLFDTDACQTLWKKDFIGTRIPSEYHCGRYQMKMNEIAEIGNFILRFNEERITIIKVVVDEDALLQCLKRSQNKKIVARICDLQSRLTAHQKRKISVDTAPLIQHDQAEANGRPDTFLNEDKDEDSHSMKEDSKMTQSLDQNQEEVSFENDVPDMKLTISIDESVENETVATSNSRTDFASPHHAPVRYHVNNSEISLVDDPDASLGILKGKFLDWTGTLIPVVIKLDSPLRDLPHEDRILKDLALKSSCDSFNCPSVKSYFFNENPRYLVLESHGVDLRNYFFDENQGTQDILAELILEALANIHQYNIMHGDIKPSNILVMVDHRGTMSIKFCDFDSSRLLSSEQPQPLFPSRAGKLKYSPGWEAPEVHFGIAGVLLASKAIDLFSVGLVLHVLFQNLISCQSNGLPQCDDHRSRILSTQQNIEDYLQIFSENTPVTTNLKVRRHVVSQMCFYDPDKRKSAKECQDMFVKDNSPTVTSSHDEIVFNSTSPQGMEEIRDDGNLLRVIERLFEQSNRSQSKELQEFLNQKFSDVTLVTQKEITGLTELHHRSQDKTIEYLNSLSNDVCGHGSQITEVLRIAKKLDFSQQFLENQLTQMRSSNDEQLQRLSLEIDSIVKSFGLFQNSLDSSLSGALEKSFVVDLIAKRLQSTLNREISDAFHLQQKDYQASFLELKKSIQDSISNQSAISVKLDLLLSNSDSISKTCDHLTELMADSKITHSEFCDISKQLLKVISDLNQTTFQSTHLPVFEALNLRMKELEGKIEGDLRSIQDSISSSIDERKQEHEFRGDIMELIQKIFQEQQEAPELIRKGITHELEVLVLEMQDGTQKEVKQILEEKFHQFGGDLEELMDQGNMTLLNSLMAIGTKVTTIENIQMAQVQNQLSFPQIFHLNLSQTAPEIDKNKPISSLQNYLCYHLFDYYDLHFNCSLCGKEGEKYSIRLTKESVKKMMEYVSITLQVIECLSDLFGIRIPHVSKVIHEIFGEISDEVQNSVKNALKATKQQDQKDLHEKVGKGEGSNLFNEEFIRTTSRKHQQHIKTLLGLVGDPEAANSGLQLISHNQSLVWACNNPTEECQRYRDEGVGYLSLPCEEDDHHWALTERK